ncbi:MAG TPA: hypothetical protein EYP59_07355 [Thiotrichaceae bacterium]|nr:hypothetical protein [Thiotrichaceae bacterium]
MTLFLITSVCDEGVYENDFKVIEAESRAEIAQNRLDDPYAWEDILRSSRVWSSIPATPNQ